MWQQGETGGHPGPCGRGLRQLSRHAGGAPHRQRATGDARETLSPWLRPPPPHTPAKSSSSQGYEEEEADAFDVSLTKNAQGLGITIAGYVGDKNSGAGSRGTGSSPDSPRVLLTVSSLPQSPRAFS